MRLIPLSVSASTRRKEDFLQVLNSLGLPALVIVYVIGLMLIGLQMVRKLTPSQRAYLALITILAGGALIGFAASHGAWVIVFIVGILLGWLLSEISRL